MRWERDDSKDGWRANSAVTDNGNGNVGGWWLIIPEKEGKEQRSNCVVVMKLSNLISSAGILYLGLRTWEESGKMKVPFWLIELLRRQGKGLKCGAKGNLLDFTFNSKRLFNINLRPVEVLLDFQREVLQTKDTGTWQRRTSKWLLLMGYESGGRIRRRGLNYFILETITSKVTATSSSTGIFPKSSMRWNDGGDIRVEPYGMQTQLVLAEGSGG